MTDGPISGLDHVLVGVRDLDAARRVWRDLGFTLTPRGRHIQWGTANYCIMFPEDYIELLGIRDPDLFSNHLDRFLEEREGLMGLALATQEARSGARALRQAGIEVEGPKDLRRILELESGDLEPAFSLLYLKPEDCAGLSTFICQHLTREMVWQKPWLSHANGAVGLNAVTAVCNNPQVAKACLEKLPGSRAGKGPGCVAFEKFEVRFRTVSQAAAESVGAKACGQGLANYRKPWLSALHLNVTDLAQTRRYFAEANLGEAMTEPSAGILRLPAAWANGVALEFSERTT